MPYKLKNNISDSALIQWYLDCGNIARIADKLECSTSYIQHRLTRLGISRKSYFEYQTKRCTDLFINKGLSISEIFRLTGISRETIRKTLIQQNIPLSYNRKAWVLDPDIVVETYLRLGSAKRTQKELGCSIDAVNLILKIKRVGRRPGKYPNQIREHIIKQFIKHRNISKVHHDSGISKCTITRWLKEEGIDTNQYKPKPSHFPPRLISKGVKRYKETGSQNQVAEELGVSRGTVRRWLEKYYPEWKLHSKSAPVRAIQKRGATTTTAIASHTEAKTLVAVAN